MNDFLTGLAHRLMASESTIQPVILPQFAPEAPEATTEQVIRETETLFEAVGDDGPWALGAGDPASPNSATTDNVDPISLVDSSLPESAPFAPGPNLAQQAGRDAKVPAERFEKASSPFRAGEETESTALDDSSQSEPGIFASSPRSFHRTERGAEPLHSRPGEENHARDTVGHAIEPMPLVDLPQPDLDPLAMSPTSLQQAERNARWPSLRSDRQTSAGLGASDGTESTIVINPSQSEPGIFASSPRSLHRTERGAEPQYNRQGEDTHARNAAEPMPSVGLPQPEIDSAASTRPLHPEETDAVLTSVRPSGETDRDAGIMDEKAPTALINPPQPTPDEIAFRPISPNRVEQDEALPPAQHNVERDSETMGQPDPVVHISIGRIEIRATPAQSQPPINPPVRRPPTVSLDDFLDQRRRPSG